MGQAIHVAIGRNTKAYLGEKDIGGAIKVIWRNGERGKIKILVSGDFSVAQFFLHPALSHLTQ
jgi:hypothetical protein